ncbi:hypothetical protein ABIG06_006251 [Bradyrhizobium sp. USDA 326]|uniref:hypothetical protein n=1 Tax=unclassified Bradyrhizobium TaxID=2631580 RepID=UPI0035126D81
MAVDITGTMDPGTGLPPVDQLTTNGERKDVIPRDEPEIEERRKRLVTAWVERVKSAKSHWKPAFDRMKEDQEFAFGKQWSKQQDSRYVANLTLRLVAQKTAFLYAKNPKAVAKKRERMIATSWDESQGTLNQLMQSAAMMMQQVQAQQMMPGAPPMDQGGMLQMAQGAMSGMMPMATGGMPAGGPAPNIDTLFAGSSPASINEISGAIGAQMGGVTMPGMGAGPIPGSMGSGGLGDQMGAAMGGAVAGQLPGVNPLMAQAVGSGIDIMMDAARVKNENIMIDKLARTLQLLYGYEVDNQPHPFKAMMKMTVRRAITTGVGYVKLGFERVMEERPDLEKGIADTSERLATLERLSADQADELTDEDDAEAEQLRLLLQDLMQQKNIFVREGLTYDYPLSFNIIPDTKCIELKHWTAADWVAEEFLLSCDEIEEIYGVDVRGHCQEYNHSDLNGPDPVALARSWSAGDARDGNSLDQKEKRAVVWEIYCRRDGLVYVVCDGFVDFLREPAGPEIFNERFYPWYALVFNECDDERELFPPSDVRLMRDMQLEYNRCREGLKEQRIAARPFTAVVSGSLDEEDLTKLTERAANDVVELNALQPNQDIKNLLQAYAGPGIDPNLYEVNPVYEDILRTTGIQEANLGGTSNATATQAQIAEGSRMTSMGSNIDDLNDLLTELARNGGQILLREMSQDRVKKIVGVGAVWPSNGAAQDIANEVLLEIEAGSMGRPNAAQEVANAQRIYPLLIQLPGIDPEFLAKDLLRRLDDRLDLTEAFKSSMPSIVAMNGAASRPTAPGAGMGPGASAGPQGAMNAATPAGPAPGGPPDQTGQLTGTAPPRPHPSPAGPPMPG